MTGDDSLAVAAEIGGRILADGQFSGSADPWPYELAEFGGRASGICSTIYAGVPGIVHYLLALFKVTNEERWLVGARHGCDWLRDYGKLREEHTPGLYIGAAGAALAFLELAEATDSAAWMSTACELAEWIVEQPNRWLDLMNGPPGQGLLYLAIYEKTGGARWLERARDCARAVDNAAVPWGEQGGSVWSIRDLTERRWITPGLSHGAAGVAFFLHALSRMDPGSGAAAIGERADQALLETAHPRAGGLDWTWALDPPNDTFLVQWCHGAPGVAIGLLNSPDPRALPAAEAAGRVTIEAGDNRSQASQCHGVCGNAETLIELYRQTGDEAWLEAAFKFGEMALEHRLPDGGPGAFRTHDTDEVTHDLMTGIAGVGYFFLRLARPLEIGYPVLGRWLPQPAN